MLLLIQLALSFTLVTVAIVIVVLWLLLLGLSYSGQGGLMPWLASGAVLYGVWLVVLAVVLGAPGMFWLSRLTRHVSPMWQKALISFRWGATVTLSIGIAAVVGAMAKEEMRPKDPFDGCVSYRDAAASAAMAVSGAKPEVDCPAPK